MKLLRRGFLGSFLGFPAVGLADLAKREPGPEMLLNLLERSCLLSLSETTGIIFVSATMEFEADLRFPVVIGSQPFDGLIARRFLRDVLPPQVGYLRDDIRINATSCRGRVYCRYKAIDRPKTEA